MAATHWMDGSIHPMDGLINQRDGTIHSGDGFIYTMYDTDHPIAGLIHANLGAVNLIIWVQPLNG